MKIASEVESLVRDSFCNVASPGDDIICHECPECFELFDSFNGQIWTNIPDDLLVSHLDSLPLFSDSAKQYFYPAYLIYAIHHPESSVAEFLLYSLASDFRHQPETPYSLSQIKAIFGFLDILESSRPDYFDKDILQARTYWTHKAEQDAAANP